LEDLAPIIDCLAEKVYSHRKENVGFVPLSVFEHLLGMGGMTVSVQTVNEVWSNGKCIGFGLRKRDDMETGDEWANRYHSTCCTLRMYDTPKQALERNAGETLESIPDNFNTEFLGVTLHNEPERRSTCLTVMHRQKVSKQEVEKFIGVWKIFSQEDIRNHNQEIVDHNWYLLEWVLDPKRPLFADVRNGWTVI